MLNRVFTLLLFSSLLLSCEPEIPKKNIGVKTKSPEEIHDELNPLHYKLKVFVHEERFTISLPDFLKDLHAIKPEAEMVYSDLRKNLTISVFDVDKDTLDSFLTSIDFYREENEVLIEHYARFQMKHVDKNAYNLETSELLSDMVKNRQAKYFTISGTLNSKMDRFKTIGTVIEGEKRLYYINMACLEKDFEKYIQLYTEVISSFDILSEDFTRNKNVPKSVKRHK